MVQYLIGFEGRGTRPYDVLQDAIHGAGGVRLLDGLWGLDSQSDASEIRDWVHSLMDDEDAIFVLQLKPGQHWASRHLKTVGNDWLKTHL